MVALPQIRCQLHNHAKQYDNDGACHNKRNGGKLHGNISRNGYGNVIIGRYGGCFEEGKWWVIWYRQNLRGTREASNGGRVRVRIIHGLNISHKELTYLLQKSISYRNKVLLTCSYGDRLVGKDHRSSPTATHKDAQARYTSCFKFVTQL